MNYGFKGPSTTRLLKTKSLNVFLNGFKSTLLRDTPVLNSLNDLTLKVYNWMRIKRQILVHNFPQWIGRKLGLRYARWNTSFRNNGALKKYSSIDWYLVHGHWKNISES